MKEKTFSAESFFSVRWRIVSLSVTKDFCLTSAFFISRATKVVNFEKSLETKFLKHPTENGIGKVENVSSMERGTFGLIRKKSSKKQLSANIM